MSSVWDYDINELKKTESGRLLILERQINYGVYLHDHDKLKLTDVKKYWEKLNIDPKRKRFLQFVIWGK
ncbi:MAG: hypothetical protein Q7K55_05940 [Candidatus Levybacteria bacterium]|nr:hypothetical protein [Candidatus Levybacteria bacterium]